MNEDTPAATDPMETDPTEMESAGTEQAGTTIKRRKPLEATLLSLCMPGLGHLYCGMVVPALAWAALSTVAGLLALWLLAHQIVWSAWLPTLVVQVAAAASSWYVALGCPADYRLQPWNRTTVYVLFLVICSVGGLGHAVVVRDQYVAAYVTPSSSMAPTLNKWDRFLVDKTAYKSAAIESNDIVVFANPANPAMDYVKRIIALSGDRVEIKDGQLLVNDVPVGEPNEAVEDFGPVEVPEYNCFVMGDNVTNSKDSRHFGPVPYATVRGRVFTKYWPPVGAID